VAFQIENHSVVRENAHARVACLYIRGGLPRRLPDFSCPRFGLILNIAVFLQELMNHRHANKPHGDTLYNVPKMGTTIILPKWEYREFKELDGFDPLR